MKKYFNVEDDEFCYPLDYFIDNLEPDQKEIVLYEAKMDVGEPYFFCTQSGCVGEVGESCGKDCEDYEPRNGKSGRCKYSKNCYSPVKKVLVKIKENGKTEIINLDEDESKSN